MAIDYRALLEKYVEVVFRQESVTFIHPSEFEGCSEQDISEIVRISNEVQEKARRIWELQS